MEIGNVVLNSWQEYAQLKIRNLLLRNEARMDVGIGSTTPFCVPIEPV